MRLSASVLTVFVLLGGFLQARGDGPADNRPDSVRPIPPPGIEVSDADRADLDARLSQLAGAIQELSQNPDTHVRSLLPDVQIFHKAVHDALAYNEFFKPEEIDKARFLLEEGLERASQLLDGQAPWTSRSGLVVRGFVSKIDGSVQPYGLVIPESYPGSGKDRFRLDVWFHGRGETLSEVNFLDDHRQNSGLFTPADTIVLHPYGRYCNAFKFAGEVDVLESIEDVRRDYRIDEDRISVRGFSMGGAAAWQFAVHYADRWFAANPGAGFAETPRFLDVFQRESLEPTWYERKLWHLYDCDDVAANLLMCPTVAYSGEIDRQKQAADVMAKALEKLGVTLKHVIGPGTAHSYHPDAKLEVERCLNSLAEHGRRRMPRKVTLVTYTLKYNRMDWVTIDALGEHWEKASVTAEIKGPSDLVIQTENVRGLSLSIPPGFSPSDPTRPVAITIDDQTFEAPSPLSDRSWGCKLVQDGSKWALVTGPEPKEPLRKRHNLQGPIDDAFMDSFVFVRPTGPEAPKKVESWVRQELDHALKHWRSQFRGEARLVDDTAVDEALMASSNIVLWGTPTSNRVLGRIAESLPIRWEGDSIRVNDRSFRVEDHAVLLIYPNPLNPERYVVLNSGFTFREYDYLNNARQVPKLPDWAIVDVNTSPNSRAPGRVVDADFFDESWQLKPPRE